MERQSLTIIFSHRLRRFVDVRTPTHSNEIVSAASIAAETKARRRDNRKRFRNALIPRPSWSDALRFPSDANAVVRVKERRPERRSRATMRFDGGADKTMPFSEEEEREHADRESCATFARERLTSLLNFPCNFDSISFPTTPRRRMRADGTCSPRQK